MEGDAACKTAPLRSVAAPHRGPCCGWRGDVKAESTHDVVAHMLSGGVCGGGGKGVGGQGEGWTFGMGLPATINGERLLGIIDSL